MLESALLAFFGVFVYIQIGYRIGQVSWWTWTSGKAPKILKALMFPGQAFFNEASVGAEGREPHEMGAYADLWIPYTWRRSDMRDKVRDQYYLLLALTWPIKVTANTLTGIVFYGTYGAAYGAAMAVRAIMIAPEAAAKKIGERLARRRMK